MTTRFDYDSGRDPPAPVLPVRVATPGGEEGALLPALVDSGADVTVVPESVAARMGLPVMGEVRVVGVDGVSRHVLVHAAELEAGGEVRVAEVIAIGEEALLGRNVLNLWVLTLHGPGGFLELTSSGA